MIAIIPARGGSKGLPRKNVRLLAGEPLIVHSLRAALAAASITRVLVSTDDDEIAAVAALIPGVEVPFRRPDELSGDTASAVDVYLHAADWLRDREGKAPDVLVPLLPTSPLRLPEDIDAAVALYRERNAEVVLSVQQAKPLAWHQDFADDQALSPISAMPAEQAVANRQALGRPPVVLNGSIYVLNIEALRQRRSYFGPRTYGYLMPADRSVDIDRIEDFRLAEALLASRATRQ